MYNNTKCTLYLKTDNYQRTVTDCFLTHRKIANQSKNGASYQESAFIMLKTSKIFSEGKDYVVEGECNKILNMSSQETFSSSMKELMASNTVYTIMMVDKKDYGSPELRHVELSCK